MRIDALDRAVIMALEQDGRRPYREIARELGVSEGTVRGRVSKLIESESLKITAIGSPLKLGLDVMAITLLKLKPGNVPAAAALLATFSNVRFVGTAFGTADIIIQTLHGSIAELHEFVSATLPEALPALTNSETFQLAEVQKSSWDWEIWFALKARSEVED